MIYFLSTLFLRYRIVSASAWNSIRFSVSPLHYCFHLSRKALLTSGVRFTLFFLFPQSLSQSRTSEFELFSIMPEIIIFTDVSISMVSPREMLTRAVYCSVYWVNQAKYHPIYVPPYTISSRKKARYLCLGDIHKLR